VAVSLEVDDIDVAYETLARRGVAFLGAPEKQPWGGTLAICATPTATCSRSLVDDRIGLAA
jgi:uncharacterized glyoxalase superfamily protein PhnB